MTDSDSHLRRRSTTSRDTAPRAHLLDTVVRILFVLAVVAATPSMALALAQGNLAIAVVDAVALFVLGVVRFEGRLSYRARSLAILGLTYGVGTWFLFEIGWVSHTYLVAVPVMAALLLGRRPAVAALVLVSATVLFVGAVLGEGPYLKVDTVMSPVGEPTTWAWVVVVVNFAFIATTLTLSSLALFERFEESLAEKEATSEALGTVVHAVDQASEVVLVSDSDGKILYANASLDRMVHDLGTHTPPTTIAALGLVDTEGTPLAERVLAHRPWDGDALVDVDNDRDDVRVYRVSVSPVNENPGRKMRDPRAVTVLSDITEARLLEERLRHGEKLEAMGMLAGGVAHDLNNIVAAILAVSESAEHDAAGTPAEHKLRAIAAAGSQAGDIVRQLMSLGQRVAPDRTPTPLRESIADLETLLRAVVGPMIDLDVQLDANDVVLATPTEVNQILTNLVINARDAIRPGPGRVWITLVREHVDQTTDQPGVDERAHLQLRVGDTGSGIPPDHIDKIFRPFFTTKPQGEGTGLGLPSVHALVTSLGGTIDVTSVVGHGTEFTIRLPVVVRPAPVTAERTPDTGPPDTALGADDQGGTGGRIVLVDDEPLLLSMCAGSLRRHGYDVTSFSNGTEAMAHLRRDLTFDLLITDLSLPDISGFEVLAAYRSVHPDRPAVIMSGSILDRPDLPEVPNGVSVMEKPFTVAELLHSVRSSIQRTDRE